MKADHAMGRVSGVTLIELMMGLAVLAILGALALPAMGSRLERQRLAMAAETLAADLTEARFEAARRGVGMQMNALTSADGKQWCWTVAPAAASVAPDCACALTRSCDAVVYTDSSYVQKGISEWIHGWKRNGWRTADKKPVKNADLWLKLDELAREHRVDWRWVKGHAGHPENERADALANRGVEMVLAGATK